MMWHTFVFLSTHSKQDRVGLLRFCFFFAGSLVVVGDGVLLWSWSSSSGDAPRPGLGAGPGPLLLERAPSIPLAAVPHSSGESGAPTIPTRAALCGPRRSELAPASAAAVCGYGRGWRSW